MFRLLEMFEKNVPGRDEEIHRNWGRWAPQHATVKKAISFGGWMPTVKTRISTK